MLGDSRVILSLTRIDKAVHKESSEVKDKIYRRRRAKISLGNDVQARVVLPQIWLCKTLHKTLLKILDTFLNGSYHNAFHHMNLSG